MKQIEYNELLKQINFTLNAFGVKPIQANDKLYQQIALYILDNKAERTHVSEAHRKIIQYRFINRTSIDYEFTDSLEIESFWYAPLRLKCVRTRPRHGRKYSPLIFIPLEQLE